MTFTRHPVLGLSEVGLSMYRQIAELSVCAVCRAHCKSSVLMERGGRILDQYSII